MNSDTIYRTAFHRSKTVGALYDITREQFVPGHVILNPKIQTIDIPAIDLTYSMDSSIINKWRKTNLGYASLPSEIKFQEDFQYFKQPKSDTNSVQAILKYHIQTKKDEFDPYSCDISNQGHDPNATHVVIEVTWGACIYILFESKLQDEGKDRNISGLLGVLLEKTIAIINGKIGGEWTKNEINTANNFKITVLGDFPSFSEKTPTSIQEIPPFLIQIPKIIKKVNDGKGVPLEYTLYPLVMLNLSAKLYQNVDGHLKAQINDIIQRIENLKFELDSFFQECSQVKEIILGNLFEEINDYSKKLQKLKEQFLFEVKQRSMAIQESRESNSKLESFLDTFEINKITQEFNLFMEEKKGIREKYKLFAFMKNNGVKLEQSFDSFGKSNSQSSAQESYLFLYCDKNDDIQAFQKNLTWFQHLMNSSTPNYRLALIDRANLKDSKLPENKSQIYYYINNELISSDFATTNFVQVDKTVGTQLRSCKVLARPLFVPCPKSCNKEFRTWICTGCKETICVDQNQNLQCKCCQSSFKTARFRCCDPSHGLEFLACKALHLQRDGDKWTHLFYPNGDIFIGEFQNHMKQKRGILYYKGGDIYNGDFINENITGEGTFVQKNGDYYEGEWINGGRTGKGKKIWRSGERSGDQYVGDWLNDKMTGYGTYTWANGKTYTGEFLNGKMVERENEREVIEDTLKHGALQTHMC